MGDWNEVLGNVVKSWWFVELSNSGLAMAYVLWTN